MAGRIAYILAAGAAMVGGMAFQGDLDFGDERVDRRIDHKVDRIVDRQADKVAIRVAKEQGADADAAVEGALAAAVAELIRAESSLKLAKLDESLPQSVIAQAQHRRDMAKQAVDRLADDARAQSRRDRDELRRNIRDDVRDAMREAVPG